MVAITVVLAATIYVWVSGFGGSGSSTPAISCSVDNTNDKLVIVSADPGIAWADISIKTDNAAANLTFNAEASGYLVGTSWAVVNTTNFGSTADDDVSAGESFTIAGASGNVEISLRYNPTNTIIGSWTVNV